MCNLVLGLFSPARFGIKEYMGYNIELLGDACRFLEVLISRDGEMGGMIGLYFDGACCYFQELPPSVERDNFGNKKPTAAIQEFYDWFMHRDEPILEEPKQEIQDFSKVFFIKTINKFKNLFK